MKDAKPAMFFLAAMFFFVLNISSYAQTERDMLEEWKELWSRGNIKAAFSNGNDRGRAHFLMGILHLSDDNLEKAKVEFYESIIERPGFTLEKTGFSPDVAQIYGELRAKLIGSLYVSSDPKNAAVYVDGDFKGRTPVVVENLLEGSRSVRIQSENHIEKETTFYISPGRRIYKHVELKSDDHVPPEISHTARESGIEGKPLRLSAKIKDKGGIESAFIHYRAGTDGGFLSVRMTKVNREGFEGAIPAEAVTGELLQYYIEAEDGNGNLAALGNDQSPFDIRIVPFDLEPPVVLHETPQNVYDNAPYEITANVSDNVALKDVSIGLRKSAVDEYKTVEMHSAEDNLFSFSVPTGMLAGDALEYYIEGRDKFGNIGYSGSPETPNRVTVIKVSPYYEGVVVARILNKRGGAGREVLINIGARDGVSPKQIFNVFTHAAVVEDPDTGEVIETNRQTLTGRIRVTSTGPEKSKAEILKENERGAIAEAQYIRSRPGKVNGLLARSDQPKRVELSWRPGPEPEIAGYNIYRADNPTGKFARIEIISGRAKTEIADKGSYQQKLIDAKKYYYRVAAFNKDKVEGEASVVTAVSTMQDIALYRSLRVLSGETGQVVFVWKAGGGNISSMEIERSDKPDGPFITVLTVENIQDGKAVYFGSAQLPLVDGKEYFFRIAASEGTNGSLPPSLPVKGASRARPLPVVGLKMSGTPVRSVLLEWNLHPNPMVEGYNVYRRDSAEGEFKKIATLMGRTVTEFRDKGSAEGLEYGKTYTYSISSFITEDFESGMSKSVSAITAAKPQPLSNISASRNRVKSISVAWEYSQNEDVEAFAIYRREDGKENEMIKKIPATGRNEFTDRGGRGGGLTAGKSYYYAVVAVSHSGINSDLSPEVMGAAKNAPPKVENLSGSNGDAGQTTLSWRPATDGATGTYRIYRSLEPDNGFENLIDIKGPRSYFTDLHLKDGTRYYYKVTLIDEDVLESEVSDTVFIKTKPLPDPPRNLATMPGLDTVELKWERPEARDVERYNIYSKGLFRSSLIGESFLETFVVEGLESDQTVSFYVTAVDENGLESMPSETVVTSTLK